MKVVTKKQMRLDELIKYVWENDLRDRAFIPKTPDAGDHGYIVRVVNGGIEFDNQGLFVSQPFQFYVVEVEEELTEDTEFEELVFVYDDYAHRPLSGSMVHKSIHDILEYKSPIYKIYALVNRSLVLIWSSDHGIPSEGTLEI